MNSEWQDHDLTSVGSLKYTSVGPSLGNIFLFHQLRIDICIQNECSCTLYDETWLRVDKTSGPLKISEKIKKNY